MKIAVIGAGNIGRTMGKKWSEAGHEVVFGVRDVNSPKVVALLQEMGVNGRINTIANALAYGDIIPKANRELFVF